ncbi:MAG TPA: D-alanyl-D-alanine carboxypeptidase/D-alanyl-D-alanine-endopeptidase [Kofleriaceae bacterium]|nr:D-alanyl-D-alanine carboxypeptidase/D-alanyl-D-alanine-endopeptidase [Kofleriaceae bacterium]
MRQRHSLASGERAARVRVSPAPGHPQEPARKPPDARLGLGRLGLVGLVGLLGAIGLAAAPADARPARVRAAATRSTHDGAHARVAINHAGDLRPAREAVGRREEPLTLEEETARQIEKLLRGPLRYGVTGLFVADARTGEALFAVNAEDPLNPASNVKMISTAAALELLGPEFRYPTRLLGAIPVGGVVHGDVYLLGSYDPTLTAGDLDELAAALAAHGITRIDGAIVVGADPTRDGVYRATLPITVHAGEPGAPPSALAPAGMDLVAIRITARTAGGPARPRLSFEVDPQVAAQVNSTSAGTDRAHLAVTVGGTIGRGGAITYPVVVRDRTALAAHTLRAALHAHAIALAGGVRTAELPAFVAEAAAAGSLPIELARHDSPRLADIIARVNKWSINWLADRVIMTAAALARQQPPSMELALSAMYDWLIRHPRIARSDLIVDTGSGLSYHTRITPHELVSIVRSAAGFAPDGDAQLARAWLDSLSIAGTDGTLSSRFRAGDVRGRIRGKTGTLSTVIALSGVLDVDPGRPLAFSLVTNGDTPLSPRYVRRAHEQVLSLLCRYAKSAQQTPAPSVATDAAPPVSPAPDPLPIAIPGEADRSELDELEPDPTLEDETAAPASALP